MIRVFVADDHSIVRQGICRLLAEADGIQVIGDAADGQETLTRVLELKPDVLVLDISMPRIDGLETLRRLKQHPSSPKVVILSMHGDTNVVEQALQEGALGYVIKQSVTEELIAAVQAAARGSLYLSAEVSQILAHQFSISQSNNLIDRLSPREREVVALIIEGYSAKQIALQFKTSIKTVEKQRLDAMHKLEIDNVATLVRVGLELGLGPKKGHKL